MSRFLNTKIRSVSSCRKKRFFQNK